MEKTIAAVIVTYNRKELLLKNIRSCLSQNKSLNKIIIIDNHSTDGTKDYIFNQLEDINIIDYQYLEVNSGGSGGFNYGTKYAYDQGYDYFWLMDDDGRPLNNNTLSVIVDYIEENNLINIPLMLNSLVMCNNNDLSFGVLQDNKIIFKKEDVCYSFISNFCNAYNGTLLSKELINKIGLPRGDYFIKGDEKEYLARAIKNRVYCGTVTNSLYYHPSPTKVGKSKYIFGKEFVNNIENGWKEYYNMRNVCLNYKLYKKHKYLSMLKYYFVRVIKICLYSNEKLHILKMSTQGFIHSLFGITGIYYLPNGKKNKKLEN